MRTMSIGRAGDLALFSYLALALAAVGCSGNAATPIVTPPATIGSTSAATSLMATKTSKTPASCLKGATPAPIPAGGSLGPGHLIAAWGATVGGSAVAPTNGSVRDMAQVSLDGTALRIRLINPDTSNSLVVCAAYVGLQKS